MSRNLKNKKTVVIGVTGQLGTGKSTVAAMFAASGAGVSNADLLVHRGLRSGGACFIRTLKAFGHGILRNGEIDRNKLAQIVFNDGKQLKKLVRIIHPFVAREMRKEIKAFKSSGKRIIVLDVPLLFESGIDRMTDFTIAVKTSHSLQISRILRQGRLTKAEAVKRMKFQYSMAEKIRRADIIINNGGTLKNTEQQVKKILQMLKKRY